MRMRVDRLTNAVAAFFMIGSACFAIGSVPSYLTAVGAEPDAITFFIGSLFFTTASYGQLLLAQDALAPEGPHVGEVRIRLGLNRWAPRDANWASAASQFLGTLYFNVTTFNATLHNLSVAQEDAHVWRPDFIGSVLFLVSSALALAVLGRAWRAWRPSERPWSMAWLNMLGSIAFMASAIAGYIVPSTGDVVDQQWVNGGTFIGAVCFFVGAALLIGQGAGTSDASTAASTA